MGVEGEAPPCPLVPLVLGALDRGRLGPLVEAWCNNGDDKFRLLYTNNYLRTDHGSGRLLLRGGGRAGVELGGGGVERLAATGRAGTAHTRAHTHCGLHCGHLHLARARNLHKTSFG